MGERTGESWRQINECGTYPHCATGKGGSRPKTDGGISHKPNPTETQSMNFALTTTGGNAQTMTLKEITDLLDVRHNNAIRTVEAMMQEPEFGLATKIEYPIISGKGREQFIETYQLNKRQSIAVAAKLNTALLMRIIDRWQELEQATQVIADALEMEKEAMLKDLKLDATIEATKATIEISKAKGEAAKARGETAKLKLQALKDRLVRDKAVLESKTAKLISQGAKIKGDMTASKLSMPTDTITNLLLAHGSKLTPAEANNALVRLGYLSPNKAVVTSTGSYYGTTIKPSPTAKTSVARWYIAEFGELLPILTINK